jgi:carboxylate-amine ligase
VTRTEPQWARWPAGARDWTLGLEEEVMLVDPADRRLANAADEVLEAISPELAPHVSPETHAGALELATGLSANSPFWRGSDSGLASARVPLFQSFPRVGIPRRFDGYDAWIAAVVPLVDSGAIPDPTYLWWDVRLQPRFGTVEVRIMDAQTSLRDVAALVAFVPAVARLEAVERYAPEALLDATEVLDENRFLAARDGVDARLIDPVAGERVPVRALVARLVAAARPHAAELGGERTLDLVDELVASPPARRQRTRALGPAGLAGVVGSACAAFARGGAPGQPAGVGSSDAAG